MDENDCLNYFLNNNVEKNKISQISESNLTECALRRERDSANKVMLTETMKGYSDVIESVITGEKKEGKKVQMAQTKTFGESRWTKHKKLIAEQEDGVIVALNKVLYPERYLPQPQETEENNYEQEMSRLQDQRTVRYQHEQQMAKNRTSNKIKAKNYHKHQRKRDMSFFLEKASKEQNKDEFKEKLDCLRAEERMSLKHKSGGKFAKLKKLKAKFNDDAKEALENMHIKGQELTRKIDADSDSEAEEEESIGNKAYSDENSEEDSNIEEMGAENAHMDVAVNHNLKTHLKEMGTDKISLKVANVISCDQPMLFDDDENTIDDDSNEAQLCANKELFKEAIYQIYQEDDELAAEFQREKAKLVEKEAPKDVSTFLPGWGCWTGPGMEKKDERRREKGMIKAPTDNRKDLKKSKVYIKQGVHEGLKKHLIKTIPYPYNTIEQFEMSRKQLVSSAFNHEMVSRNLCKTKYRTKAGNPIRPCGKVYTKSNEHKTKK